MNKEQSARAVYLRLARVVIYFISRMRTSRENTIRKIASRDPQSIARLLSNRIRQIYRDSRGRTYRSAPLIRARVILSSHRHTCTLIRTRIHTHTRAYTQSAQTLYDPIDRTKIPIERTNERREYILQFLSRDPSSFRECEN